MTMFVLGLAGWCVAHLMPSVAPGLRGRLMSTVGAGPYKGLFALTIVGSLLLIIFGWRAADSHTEFEIRHFLFANLGERDRAADTLDERERVSADLPGRLSRLYRRLSEEERPAGATP